MMVSGTIDADADLNPVEHGIHSPLRARAARSRRMFFAKTSRGGHCRRERSPRGRKTPQACVPEWATLFIVPSAWGCPGEGAWIDPLPGGISGSGASEVAVAVAGGRPGSTTTRVPTITRE
jgi:hypothetical protein